ncbi:MAG: AbrB/MazE/SpoVT family DNA-binding domain-containing protein [Caldilineaceae bacterium]|nr:AbrB/MazE/SpoVT family DNA-binding domain-containing protein [Caldilineaceae bacterium]
MDAVTVSPKYQVVIPRKVREALGIEPGQKVQVIAYQNRIELVPIRSARSLRGFLKGIDTSVEREADRI